MRKNNKKIMPVVLSVLLAIAMMPAMVFSAARDSAATWDVSKSKTATQLDENFNSKVTLSLPAAEEQLASDVVFVFDESSCGEPVQAKVNEMLGKLAKQLDESKAAVKIGAVSFRGCVNELPLTPLSDETKDTVTEFMDKRPDVGGSNMHKGLLVAQKMLDGDTSVDDSRKYMVLVSDGIAYIWDDNGKNMGVNFANGDTPNSSMLASPDAWDVKYGQKHTPDDWTAHFAGFDIDKTITGKASEYVRGSDLSTKPFVAYGEKDDYASSVDIALYKSYEVYKQLESKYNTYVVLEGKTDEMAIFPYGPSFMKFMAGNNTVSFEQIQNDIYYLLGPGSYLVDEIGYGTDNAGNPYDFAFVDKTPTLKVGDTVLEGEKAQTPWGDATSSYRFRDMNGDEYRFEVHYYKDGTEDNAGNKYGECFVFVSNVPVSKFAPVQLTYTVNLTNPVTKSGTYGQYDADGSGNFEALYTNFEATLFPVDSYENEGNPELFPKPTVSYTVEEPTEPPTDPDNPGNSDNPAGNEDKAQSEDAAETGDSSNIWIFAGLAFTALIAGAIAIAAGRKRHI